MFTSQGHLPEDSNIAQRLNFPTQEHIWNGIVASGVCEDLRCMEAREGLSEYEHRVRVGYLNATAFLRSLDLINTASVEDLQDSHGLMFERVYPWAGSFRKPCDLAVVAGRVGADSQRIKPELELALLQMRNMLSSGDPASDILSYPLTAFSLFHLRSEAIHPFKDGNGRWGRHCLAEQIHSLWGVLPPWQHREQYMLALKEGIRGNLTPLLNFLLEGFGMQKVETTVWSPFRIAPFSLGAEPSSNSLLDVMEQTRMTPASWIAHRRKFGIPLPGND